MYLHERHEDEHKEVVIMGGGRFDTQTSNDNVWVGVSSDCDTNRDSGREVAQEFIVQDKEAGEHVHIGLDENGDTVFESRR